jgi:Ni,Fe-hydrogenase III small subunit
MHRALVTAYEAMPEPRLVAALGDCALGCNVLGNPTELTQGLENILPVHVRIPGCPPDPERIAAGLLEALRLAQSTPPSANAPASTR